MDDICPFTKLPCVHKKVTHITEVKDGKSQQELHLCQSCTEQYMSNPNFPDKPLVDPIQPPNVPSVGGLLGLLGLLTLGALARQKREAQTPPDAKCPGCGITPAEITQTGKFGCPQCYDYYKSAIDNVVVRCQQGATKHVGKIPPNAAAANEKRRLQEEDALDIADQIKALESKMANAIKIENYEVAGVLRDKIAELRTKLPTTDGT